MLTKDLPKVNSVANFIHADFYEAPEVFAEKLKLYPSGCFVYDTNNIQGYFFSHPWYYLNPPKLNTLLGHVRAADTYYIHDVALMPDIRGQHLVAEVVELVDTRPYDTISLVSVNQTFGYWSKFGFEIVPGLDLTNYSPDAVYMVKSLTF
jgi:hypothetical protein